MIFLRSYRVEGGAKDGVYPFSIESIRQEKRRAFESSVTFFAGENGSGKSTLLEGLARAMAMPALGAADTRYDDTLAAVDPLASSLRLVWNRRPRQSFFLRSEDFFGFIRRLAEMRSGLQGDLHQTRESYAGRSRYAQMQAASPYLNSLDGLEGRYGVDADAQSHGETFMSLFSSRMVPGGLYLLDEPESALSPTRQMALLSMLHGLQESCQFIIATHSPILLALPGAQILSFDDAPICPIRWSELPHVTTLQSFLAAPERFLRYLLAENDEE